MHLCTLLQKSKDKLQVRATCTSLTFTTMLASSHSCQHHLIAGHCAVAFPLVTVEVEWVHRHSYASC